MTRPDLDAIRARCEAAQVIFARNSVVAPCVYDDIPALLAYIDELESCTAFTTSWTIGETEWAHRVAVAEQRFVDECDAHQETCTILTDLWRKQMNADAAQMREYGISYAGVRKLIAECVADEMNVGKVVELLRAAARELAKDELAELKARIATLEGIKK
jgi:hypothetical protein